MPNARSFRFTPRYYDKNKERREVLEKTAGSSLKFKQGQRNNITQKGKRYRIIFLIIILSLLAYKLLIS